MDNKDIWIVSTKSRRMDGCQLDDDGSDFYFVECLIPSSSFEEASGSIEHLLRDKQLELCEVLRCEIYDAESWVDTEQFSQIESAAETARRKGEPKFALFISSEAMSFNESEESEESDNDEVEWD
ncbi:hypothetical protein ACJJID_14705 [Microbulbifer sp. CnH-101-G]|uniref:hypothetical protein n=1 Tax=Microbulbifer sp. CnH-101-G TaxID=3243393 RepID=UPI0040397986